MAAELDVTQVPPQSGYIAKQCPVRAQNEVLVPAQPLPVDVFTQRLVDRGVAYEAAVTARLRELHPRAVVIESGGSEAERATLDAMRARASLILNGRLCDAIGRRVGKPDLLIAAKGGGYHAADIKCHMTVDVRSSERQRAALIGQLVEPERTHATTDQELTLRSHEDDALQLAHYQRMLETLGFAAGDDRWGAIIGTEGFCVWHDLDLRQWRTPSVSEGTKLRSTMECYDFEFGFRLDIIAVAQQHLADPAIEPLVVPVRCSECPSCPWRAYCLPKLEGPPADVSLLPRIGFTQWKAHHDHGTTGIEALATLDTRTARLVAAGIRVDALVRRARDLPSQTDVIQCLTIFEAARDDIVNFVRGLGVQTAGDVLDLDDRTASYTYSGITNLPDQINMARAALGRAVAYRGPGVGLLQVPTADVEIDVDMENTEVGCFMWGCLLSERFADGITRSYVPFVTWELSDESEAAIGLAFWQWLIRARDAAVARGNSFAAYCWNSSAENRFLRRLGRANDLASDVDRFIASDEWVDLMRVWDSQLITGGSSSLKRIAPSIGHRWLVNDPGGGQAMAQYDLASSGNGSAREWLLSYNEDDVRATAAIRDWMRTSQIPSIAEWDKPA
jgi:predicted RecB family nuclease